ncbi:MAG: hypothetical protein ACFFEF_17820 [Candidatus Thorarchaeota archaeon]
MRRIGIISLLFILFATPVFILPGGFNASALNEDDYIEACLNLQPGWTSDTIYQSKPLGPISICENGDNDVFILDKAAHEIVELELDGTVSTYLSIDNFSFNAIAYQPNADRIIALGESAFYDTNSLEVMEEHPFGIEFSTFVVDSNDDSIYTGHWANSSTIYHFDSNGALLSTIRSDIQGCAQLALDSTNNLLYYSETFPGRITMLNLTTNSTTVLTSGIAIPGTGEGISIAVSPLGDLYYMVAEGNEKGFWEYNGTAFENIMGSKNGIGPIVWSQRFDSVLCAAGAGACIVKYDPTAAEPERITPTVNTGSIVETSTGLLLLGVEDTIYQIESGVFSEFIADLDYPCGSLVLDGTETIYASLANDSPLILRVYPNGTYSTWFSGQIDGSPASLTYDPKNDMMVLLTSVGMPTRFDLWKIPVSDPDDYFKVLSINNVTNGDCTVDNDGNIYVLERSSNNLYKIPNGINETQVLHSNVVEHAYLVAVNIEYSSILDGIILARNDDLQVWPVSGANSYLLAENNVGIDNDGVFENANHELVCTHSGQVFRLSYNEQSSPFPIEVLIVGVGALFVVIVAVLYLKRK